MKAKFNGILTLLIALSVQFVFAQKTVSGTVSDESGALPGASVMIKGTKIGTETDFDGKYSIQAKQGDVLVFSYVGLGTVEKTVGGANVIDVVMAASSENVLEEVVVTALGVKREEKTLPYSSQQIKQEDLNITQSTDFKSAIAGKVAGVQLVSQAGSKLGQFGKIRIRGAVSLTTDGEPLYIVDNIPVTDPNVIDLEAVESINTLKGPNATALYGQRAEYGVVIITTKKAKKNSFNVEIFSSTTYDNIAYLPNYQNEYGQGAGGQDDWAQFAYDPTFHPSYWSTLNGKYNTQTVEDASWGPKFDGSEYLPWYAWWPDSPYFGKTAKWEAQPNNIKDFYNTGTTNKTGINISGGNDIYTGKFFASYVTQGGVMPQSEYNKLTLNGGFDFKFSEKLLVGTNIVIGNKKVKGDFNDDYSNETSGSFNQWFGRDLDMNIMRELAGLKTPEGYATSWNWWSPDYGGYGDSFLKPTFWFNPYYWLNKYEDKDKSNDILADVHSTYTFNDNLSATINLSKNLRNYSKFWTLPYEVEYSSAHDLYMEYVNSFGRRSYNRNENNAVGMLNYKNRYGKFDFDIMVGGQLNSLRYESLSAQMGYENYASGGLMIQDLYIYGNSKEQVVPITNNYSKKINSIYGKANFGFDDTYYLDASLRKDYSSALPNDNNGYSYPSIGGSIIFSNLLKQEWLNFGKIRFGYAQVGSDVDAGRINQTYPIYQDAYNGYNGLPVQWTNNQIKDPNLRPAINTAQEIGVDLKMFKNRFGLKFTYYDELRKDEIVPIQISAGTGYSTYLTNAGESHRNGIELSFDFTPIKTDKFVWDATLNYAKNKTEILKLPGDLQSLTLDNSTSAFSFVAVTHPLNGTWGQIRGAGYKVDANGNYILKSSGLYEIEQNKLLGSVLPDFTGGFLNSFNYKNLSLNAMIDFQKGGNFFSLSEMWGTYTGLLEETAGLNDLGNPQRDPVDLNSGVPTPTSGGVHVTGVDATGNPVDTYVEAQDYYHQWYANRLAEPFVHDASYIKLRDVSLSYTFDFNGKAKNIKNLTVGAVGRNLLLLYVDKSNKHGWDPSEMSRIYGEDGQLPGTRSYGVNVKIAF